MLINMTNDEKCLPQLVSGPKEASVLIGNSLRPNNKTLKILKNVNSVLVDLFQTLFPLEFIRAAFVVL